MKTIVKKRNGAGRLAHVMVGALFGVATLQSAMASVNIAQAPLFVAPAIDPNIMFLIDDSGSMHWEVTPDDWVQPYYMFPRTSGNYGGGDYNNSVPSFRDDASRSTNERFTAAFYRSSSGNATYYNPAVTYTPWARGDGTYYPNANPTAAYHHPVRTSRGSRNLTTDNSQSATWYTCSPSHSCSSTDATRTFYPAVYYFYNGGGLGNPSNYTKVEIRSTTPNYTGHGRENRTDCAGATASPPRCTYAEEIQNFANWYTYYRSRLLAAQAGIGRAFAQQKEEMRVGFGAINQGSSTIDGVNTETIQRGVRPFSGTDRQQFFDLLYTRSYPPSSTPLRTALDDAGQYFSRKDSRGPWSNTPGFTDAAPDVECRQSYTILMTDGYWTSGSDYDARTSAARANVDGTGGPSHTGPEGRVFTYEAESPFTDGNSNTLADVAMYYWKNDLRTDMENKVPTTFRNPAFWQHMVTFGVGLGVTGSINPDTAWDALETGATINWPNPTSNSAKLDDLLHAAVNGRGGFFSAADPNAFAEGLIEVLRAIVARVEASATASATSSSVLLTESKSYEAGFRSGDWTGTFRSYEISGAGTKGTLIWDAEDKLRSMSPAARKIFTHSGTGGVPFQHSSLSSAQQAALSYDAENTQDNLGAERVAWLRGTETLSLPTGVSFRSRTESGSLRLLGDIVNANPQYAGKANLGFGQLGGAEGGSYADFRKDSRPDVVYVGANDGMMHAFDALTGVELFAYIPGELLRAEGGRSHAPVSRLMATDYTHRYFVDGTPAISDAYIGGTWKSVLLGAMGAGGKTVYALDVTEPTGFDQTKVMWEFTHPDLGYGVTNPAIVRMADGRWAAVFGNGYNSTSHKAMLFIVDLATGALISKVDTGVGSAGTPNGMAAPYVTDYPNNNRVAARIYAGDLLGNLWRVDLGASLTATKVFTAVDSLGNAQPITSRPIGAPWNKRPGSLVVSFGTGSFFRAGDTGDYRVQTLYGIVDDGTTVSGRGQLVQQTIEGQTTATVLTENGPRDYTLRTVSKNPITDAQKGWYLDLIHAGVATGERVISRGSFPSGSVRNRVRFTSLIPDSDPCGSGRGGFVMDIDLFSGGSTEDPVFDLNKDREFDEKDLRDGDVVSGISTTEGEELRIIRDDGDCILGEGLCMAPGPGLDGRQSWEQLR